MPKTNKEAIEVIETYTGSTESLNKIIKNLKIKPNDFYYNLLDKSLYVHSLNRFYVPGVHYSYKKERPCDP